VHTFRSWHWSTLAVFFVFTAPTARAGMITPDSIPNPPSAVASAQGTNLYANNYVSTQYAAVGLEFSSGAAITRLNGIPVWAPIGVAINAMGAIDYAHTIFGRLVALGTLNPTTVSSLSVEIISLYSGTPGLGVDGLNGGTLNNLVPVLQNTPGPHGGQVWTFTGSSISAIWVAASDTPGTWGVAEISFTPASAPEPSSLILAGLGALGLAARLGWRHRGRLA
jgi:PEP-CTERM motif-containing protein